MGLQKGQPGYAFRWLLPIFALVDALMLFVNSIVCSLVLAGTSMLGGGLSGIVDYYYDFSDAGIFANIAYEEVLTKLKLYVATIWIIAIMMFALAILAFVMNKKGSYIFGIVGGGITTLTYFIKAIVCFWVYSKLKVFYPITVMVGFKLIIYLGLYLMIIFAFALCALLFGALALPKLDYESTFGERNMAGENLTYVGFENDPATEISRYHESNVQGRFDPYAPPVVPEPEPPKKPERYQAMGPTGKITGVNGMYRGASFTVSDNEEIVIGRDPRVAQIVIGEGAQNVSRQHCRVSYSASDNTYGVMDMSKNGTFSAANRTRLPSKVFTKVPVGTEIYLGDRNNMFRLG